MGQILPCVTVRQSVLISFVSRSYTVVGAPRQEEQQGSVRHVRPSCAREARAMRAAPSIRGKWEPKRVRSRPSRCHVSPFSHFPREARRFKRERTTLVGLNLDILFID